MCSSALHVDKPDCARCGHAYTDHAPNLLVYPAPAPCAAWVDPTEHERGHTCSCDDYVPSDDNVASSEDGDKT